MCVCALTCVYVCCTCVVSVCARMQEDRTCLWLSPDLYPWGNLGSLRGPVTCQDLFSVTAALPRMSLSLFSAVRPVLSHTLKLRGNYGRDLKLAQKFGAEIMSEALTPQQAANTLKDVGYPCRHCLPIKRGRAGRSQQVSFRHCSVSSVAAPEGSFREVCASQGGIMSPWTVATTLGPPKAPHNDPR